MNETKPKYAEKQPMDSNSVEKLSQRKEQGLRALLAHTTLEQAATACGVNSRTIRRWMRDKKFLARYRREQAALLSNTVDLLRQESASAVGILASIAKDPLTGPGASARVAACRAILVLGLKAVEVRELTERIEELEKKIIREKP